MVPPRPQGKVTYKAPAGLSTFAEPEKEELNGRSYNTKGSSNLSPL